MQWLQFILSMLGSLSELSVCKTGNCSLSSVKCSTTPWVERKLFISGSVYTIPKSHMPALNQGWAGWCSKTYQPVAGRLTKNSSSKEWRRALPDDAAVHIACYNQVEVQIGRLAHERPILLLPGFGRDWPGPTRRSRWQQYTTTVFHGSEFCFWPSVPELVSLPLLLNAPGPARYMPRVVVSDGFYENLWHVSGILNVMCTLRHQLDVVFVAQPKSKVPWFVFSWAKAFGIGEHRIVTLDRPIVADFVLTASHQPDWTCLHKTMRVRSTDDYAVVYLRDTGEEVDVTRDIPRAIHLALVEALAQALPELKVKTFGGNETLEETRRLFANARVVIGPHGAGLVNVVFCQPMTPVIEFVTRQVYRPWLMLGGHSIGLPWWPVLLTAFDSRDEILESVSVVQAALLSSSSSIVSLNTSTFEP